MLCPTLRKIEKNFVHFDPYNEEHMEAFEYMCLGKNGTFRQHPTLRFHLEDGFVDIRSMMLYKVGRAWCQHMQKPPKHVSYDWYMDQLSETD